MYQGSDALSPAPLADSGDALLETVGAAVQNRREAAQDSHEGLA